jgi:multidrug resistance efflux pump
MSSEQSSVNTETIEQTKQQIRGLVSEIAQLSKSDLNADEFYAAFLQRIVSALAAVGGAIWLLDGDKLNLVYQINISQTLLEPDSDDATKHLRMLDTFVRSAEPHLIPPLSSAGQEEAGGNPTRYLLVLAPLVSEGKVEGVVEIFQRPDSQPATQRGYLRFLVQMCELAGEWLKSQKLRLFSDRHSLWAQADHFSRLVHENLDLRDTAYTIVNEGRRLIGCDRLSIATKLGRKCKIEAISGQDTIENRSNIVAALNKLSTRVVAMGEPLWYDGSTENLPPQLEEAIDHYIDESYAKMVVVLPLRRPGPVQRNVRHDPDEESDAAENTDREAIGALIVEQLETNLPREVIEPRIDLVYEHSARAVSNSWDHSNLFLMPVWRTLGKATWLVRAKTLPKTLFVAGLLLFGTLALCTIRKDFDLGASGKLQPVERREVFVNVPGEVVDVLVEHGESVKKGQPLVKLKNTDLLVQMADVVGQRDTTREQLYAIKRVLQENRSIPEDEKTRLFGQVAELQQRLDSLDKQFALLNQKHEQLTITSPIEGEVVTWDVDETLLHRPVTTGQVLMSVADPSKKWELELLLPEKRARHLDNARREFGEDLNVRYVLATDPGNERHGYVVDVHDKTDMDEEEGHSIKVKVAINEKDLKDPRPGAKVQAEIYAGRRSVGYVWFHEVGEWIRLHVLF